MRVVQLRSHAGQWWRGQEVIAADTMYYYMCPHTTIYPDYYICVLILRWTHSAVCVSPYCYIRILLQTSICVLILYVSSYYYMCVLILLYMCPNTTIYVSSYYYIRVPILINMCPHTTIYVSSCYYISSVLILLYKQVHVSLDAYDTAASVCVLILLYMCPNTAIYLSSYYYICVLILLYI